MKAIRLIDANILLETIKNNCYVLNTQDNSITGHGMFLEGIQQAIAEQSTVNQWIPVSERLPKMPTGEDKYHFKGEDYSADEYIVMLEYGTIPTTMYWNGTEWFDPHEKFSYTVLAWQLLPEPYRESEDKQ